MLSLEIIRYLVLTGKSLTDSDEALINLFELGIDDNWRIVDNGGQIQQDLPREILEEVRKNVKLIDLRVAVHFPSEFDQLEKVLENLPPFAKPRVFPKKLPDVQTFPGEFFGYVVRGRTIFEAWCEILWTIMTFGHTSPTDYGLDQKEVLSLLSVIEDPGAGLDDVPLWAPFKREEVETYVKRFFEAQKTNDVSYHYGNRLQEHWGMDQIELISADLKRSKHSRRALASLWDPVEDGVSADPPCITTLQAVIRDRRLYFVAYIRSNDMFRAYPLNAAALCELQRRVAEHLGGIGKGSLAILSFSAHVYSDCWSDSQEALVQAGELQKRFQPDPRGSFVFGIEDGQFVSDHYSPQGDLLQSFRTDNRQTFAEMIMPFVLRIDHGMYLGREIERLESSYRTGQPYEQDRR
jgi:thymidylate synthase